MANDNLSSAKKAKNDEFYTQYEDIEKEINGYLEFDKDVFRGKTILLPCDDPDWSNFTRYFAQNFKRLGLKKLISTSYAPNSKADGAIHEPTLFEIESPEYDEIKTHANGKIFTLTKDITGDGVINFDDFEWKYLEGDGDFRSEEVKALRNEADFIITNPPFSLFRDFVAWVIEGQKKFILIGNMNAITYKEIFPLIKENKMWLGAGKNDGRNVWYEIPDSYANHHKIENGKKYAFVAGTIWFANVDHGRRHEYLQLMTKADNLKFNKTIKEKGYRKYDNYAAIEIPRVDSIPSDEAGVMGVPITFLSKYNPEQFKIIWQAAGNTRASAPVEILDELQYQMMPEDRGGCGVINGERVYARILIQHKKDKE